MVQSKSSYGIPRFHGLCDNEVIFLFQKARAHCERKRVGRVMQTQYRKLIVIASFIFLLVIFLSVFFAILRREPAPSPDYTGSIVLSVFVQTWA